jgi:hypothetical protein
MVITRRATTLVNLDFTEDHSMNANYHVTGQDRKRLVGVISNTLNEPTRYCGAPTFEYLVGDYTIDKQGEVAGPDNEELVAALAAAGFITEDEEPQAEAEAPAEPAQVAVYARLSRLPSLYTLKTPRGEIHIAQEFATREEARNAGYSEYFSTALGTICSYGDNHTFALVTANKAGDWDTTTIGRDFREPAPPAEPEPDCPEDAVREGDLAPNRLVIEYPLDGFTPEKLDNLCKLVASKEPLFKMALGVDALPVRVLEDRVSFPWFPFTEDGDRVLAYSQLIAAICRTAKEKQRVNALPKETYANPRFTARCALIALGLVGPNFKKIRHLLCSPLDGNGAWSTGIDPRAKAQQAAVPAEAETTEDAAGEALPGAAETEVGEDE